MERYFIPINIRTTLTQTKRDESLTFQKKNVTLTAAVDFTVTFQNKFQLYFFVSLE